MDPIAPRPVSAVPVLRQTEPSSAAPLSPAQQQALAKLHQTAQQMESLFANMLFTELRKSAPPSSLTGKPSQADAMFGEMLDTKRAEDMAATGALGIGKVIESQLRSAVLAEVPAAGSAPAAPRGKRL